MQNHFTLAKGQYRRDFRLVETYIEQQASYLSTMTGKPFEETKTWLINKIKKGGQFEATDRPVLYIAQNTPGNRKKEEGTFLGYIEHIERNEHIVAPTMTVYHNTDKKPSLLSKYVDHNMALRKKDKKEMLIANQNGELILGAFKKVMQNSRKIKNNSLSGAHNSTGTVLFFKSIHPTLTSTCRSATGYGNANNEKFLMGNRHYWSVETTMDSIQSIITLTDLDKLQTCIEKFNIHYPSAQEAMECVLYSSRYYWKSLEDESRILRYFEKMKPIQRAAFVYVGDMYHLAKYNDNLVRGFLGELSTPATTPHVDPDSVFKNCSGDHLALANLLCADISNGKTLEKIKEESYEGYGIIANTIQKVLDTLDKYQLMISALWVTPVMPTSIYQFPNVIRRAAIVSDTDSTIFTNQYWTVWYKGKLDFSKESLRIAYTTTFLTSQLVIHLLAMMSANMGVNQPQMHRLEMKNEYFFPVFATTSMTKHYYAYMSAQEGNVFAKNKLEIKGKNLRDSTLPEYVKKKVREFVSAIMDSIIATGKVDPDFALTYVANIEQNIIDNVNNGLYSDMPSLSIKELSVYTDPVNNPYYYHRLWNTVFGPKYGIAEEPPYKGIKLTVGLNNPTKVKKYIDSIEDRELALRLETFLKEEGKRDIGLFMIPEPMAQLVGIPMEMRKAINVRKIVYGTTLPFYMILETLGLYVVGENLSRLIIDIYTPKR